MNPLVTIPMLLVGIGLLVKRNEMAEFMVSGGIPGWGGRSSVAAYLVVVLVGVMFIAVPIIMIVEGKPLR
jgi:hypothetical protein